MSKEKKYDIVNEFNEWLRQRNIKTDKPLFLCSWNGNDVIQIHTEETLYNEYKDTNLFDEHNISWEVNGKERTFNELLKYLSLFNYSGFDDEVYINDNMTIRRIY
tara:strand:- start:3 stop:317 length:315 start_codon:yes stop_codon:yes gene_type:complete